MTKAREIIEGALGFGLNRLSPGETLDADTANSCLVALNMLCDEFNGGGSFLFRELLTAGTVTGSGTIGTTWALSPGVQILGASYSSGGQDYQVLPYTMGQYHAIPDKTLAGDPDFYSHDGYATVYFYPVPAGLSITLRTKETFSDFADLDTDYGMPKGYKAALADLLAEKMAPQLLGNVPAPVARNAANARSRLLAQAMKPAIICPGEVRGNILAGW